MFLCLFFFFFLETRLNLVLVTFLCAPIWEAHLCAVATFTFVFVLPGVRVRRTCCFWCTSRCVERTLYDLKLALTGCPYFFFFNFRICFACGLECAALERREELCGMFFTKPRGARYIYIYIRIYIRTKERVDEKFGYRIGIGTVAVCDCRDCGVAPDLLCKTAVCVCVCFHSFEEASGMGWPWSRQRAPCRLFCHSSWFDWAGLPRN